ncbi:MAG TPA: serine carboxypeptidase [Anaerolineae bacterium]
MQQVLVIHLDEGETREQVTFLGREVMIRRAGCGGDAARARALIAENDGRVNAIGLEGLPAALQLGAHLRPHPAGAALAAGAGATPVVDGAGIRAGLERWGVILADRAEPGIFSEKRVLMVPGLNHAGLAGALERRSSQIRYADPVVYFALPTVPGIGSRQTFEQAAGPTLEQLQDAPFRRIYPRPGTPGTPRSEKPFAWADILAGDSGAIRRYAPDRLKRKTIVVEWATEEDVAALAGRGAAILVTMMPSLEEKGGLGRWSAATIEAVLVALRPQPDLPLTEDTYLDLTAALDWRPHIRYLQPGEAGINRFAFVIHPLKVDFITGYRPFSWTRYLPPRLVETVAAYMQPIYLARIEGGVSRGTGQRIEGHLISLGATPRELMRHDPRFTYRRLNKAARIAERKGARIMGLGAFTKIVGDAGITVANEADIAVTSGNSLTVAATLEAAKIAVQKMGATDLTRGRVMIVGATGSIGSVCSRLIAQAIYDVVLVSIEPERLIELKRMIQEETPAARVVIGLRPDEWLGECDLIITATSAFGQRILDISKCKPGAVICDVARPADIGPEEAALRPDVLVVESGEVIIPGIESYGVDIGLPPRVAYACLAEAALLAMEGRFEDYTLGRNISVEKVKEIYHLFRKHGLEIAGLTSFGKYITEEEYAAKRQLADALRADPARLARAKAEAGRRLAAIPVSSKGVSAGQPSGGVPAWAWLAGGLAALALALGIVRRRGT